MPISFTCPHCGRSTEVADQYAGQSGPCAGCGRTIAIPAGSPATPFKPGPTAYAQPQQVPRRSSSTWIIFLALGGMCLCAMPILIALLLPAVQSAREAARRMQCVNNLKQIGLAMHNYHDTYKAFPAGFVADDDGQPLHSWRVALLPYLERADLYEQYNFDEPWNSPNNMRVADQMPDVFRCPSAPDSGPGSNLTHYVVVLSDQQHDQQPEESAGPRNRRTKIRDSIFGPNSWTKISEIRDGTSNTLLVVEVKEPVPWTQPDADPYFNDMSFNGGPKTIGSYHPGGSNALFADGAVQFLSAEADAQTLRLLVQPADGTPVQIPRRR